jgi:6-phosphogluconolactonase
MRRRIFLLIAVVAVSAGMSAAQHSHRVVLYAALGSDLATYDTDLAHAVLTKRSSVTLPFAVQYAWPHPTKKFLYVAWSNGMQGDRHGITAFRVDAAGALALHGPSIEIRHRPVHLTLDANATHVLVAYNNPSSLSVHQLNPDGTLGGEVKQPGPLDGGIYAHQIRVHPSNKMVVMVTRGNGPAANRPEDPGALKIYSYHDGILENRQSIARNGGFGYQPRHVDFHPSQPWMYLNLERQNQLQVYRTVRGESIEPVALFTRDTLDNQAASKPAQMTGAIHVHPNGRFVYISNRASGGMHARTFTLDDGGRILVAANQNAVTRRDGAAETRVPASLAVFRIAEDGKLSFVRRYEVETGQGRSLMWVGMLTLTRDWGLGIR